MAKSNVEHQTGWRARPQAKLHEAHNLERTAQRKVHGLERAELREKQDLELTHAKRRQVGSVLWATVTRWLDKLHTARRHLRIRQHPRCTLPIRPEKSISKG